MQLDKNMIKLNQSFDSKEEAIKEAGKLLVDNGCVGPDYVDEMLEREQVVSTYMGQFIAIPHGTDKAKNLIKSTGISVVQIPFGVDFAPDERGEKMAMVIFGIAGIGDEHLNILSKIALFCSTPDNVVKLVNAETEEEITDLLNDTHEE